MKYSNISGSNKSIVKDNVLLKKLMMKRTIQSYFMSSKECCSFCKKRSDPFYLIQQNLNSKYLTGMDYYNVKVVNDIIYNDTTHLVSVFKDYLIYDDISEFLKRYYNQDEVTPRLVKIYAFYDKYSKVFPNYIILDENKYMFKNIERKQIAIDERQQFFQDLEEKEKAKPQNKNSNLSQLFNQDSNQMFDTKFVDSFGKIKTNSQVTDSFPFEVVSQVVDSQIQHRSQVEDYNKSRTVRLDHTQDSKPAGTKPKPFKRLEDYDLLELVEKFLVKDQSSSDLMQADRPHESHPRKLRAREDNASSNSQNNMEESKRMDSTDHDCQIDQKIKMYTTKTALNKNQGDPRKEVFNYQEFVKASESKELKTDRSHRNHQPITNNYVIGQKSSSNDGRAKYIDHYYK